MANIIFKVIGLILLVIILLQVAIAVFNNVNAWLGILIGALTVLGLIYIVVKLVTKHKY